MRSRFGEVCSCCCLPTLPGPAWVLLNYVLRTILCTSVLLPIAVILDVHMMLFGGFGFLMTFLKRHGYSAVALTMMITVVVTGMSILI